MQAIKFTHKCKELDLHVSSTINFLGCENAYKPSISIICPTYNEVQNIKLLVDSISSALNNYKYELIFVDDNSTDGTIDVISEMSEKYPISLIVRDKKLGLSSAILTGFAHSRGNIIGVIDADLQHPPEFLVDLIDAFNEDSCDFVIASRYVPGGGVEGWSVLRLLISKFAILLSKPLGSLTTNVTDPMSGFFFLKRCVIDNVTFNPTGFKLSLEILIKGKYKKVREVPFIFRARKNGSSKLNVTEYFHYIELLVSLLSHTLKKRV